MRFSTSLIAISAAAIVQASAIPQTTETFSLALDAPEGFYLHTIDSNGKPQNEHADELKTVLPDSDPSSAPNTQQYRREAQGSIYCKNQYLLNSKDLAAAQQGLKATFASGGSFTESSVSYKSGSAVAYGCNYGDGQTITGPWLGAQFALIEKECGPLGGGWIAFPDWKASYGFDNSGVGFC